MIQGLLILTFILSSQSLFAKEIAFTFDDAPRAATQRFSGPERAKNLLLQLKRGGITQTIFFANSNKLNPEGAKRLQTYALAGHKIANHTHSHPNFNETEVATYLADIKTADLQLQKFHNFARYFRFPYLREGNSIEKRDATRQTLKALGYTNAYITVNDYDWEMDRLLQEAIKQKRKVHYDRLEKVYLEILLACVEFYDAMALQVLGRSPKHIILLHENDINALFVGKLARELQKRSWKIITPEEAYLDPIAQNLTANVYPFNPGRIGEIAKDQGYPGKLWHDSCDEDYLAAKFAAAAVFEN